MMDLSGVHLLGGANPMSFVLIGALFTFVVVLGLIVRELRRPAGSVAASGHASADHRFVTEPAEVDATKVALRPSQRKVEAPGAAIPRLAVAAEPDVEYSPSSQSALTLFEDDAGNGIDEPTGPHELIVLHSVGQTDIGKRRRRNEDSYLIMPSHALFVVADGMGGYAGGDVASNLAVDTMRRSFESRTLDGVIDPRRPRRGNELVWAVEAANDTILKTARSNDQFEGMGTTIVAARFSPRKQRVYVAHVGDSRCYRKRNGKLTQLTIDHTLGSVGVTGPYAAHLRRAVGIREHVKVDLVVDAPRAGDVYMLCSDGLSKMVPDAAINEIVDYGVDLDARTAELIRLANERGGRDNVTVILLAVLPPGRPVIPPGRS